MPLALSAILDLPHTPLFAATVELTPDRDATLYESATGTIANGTGSRFFAGLTSQGSTVNARRALLHFDLAAAVPAGSTVTSVTLTLQLSRTNDFEARDLTLHRALADWGEGTSNADANEGAGAAATPESATWIHRFYAVDLWAAAGGDFEPAASATSSVGTADGPYAWSSPGLVADVQTWVDEPAANFGWLLLGDETTSGTARRFDSREIATAAQRPRLSVTFTPPPTAGACCFGSGACGVATPFDCSNQSGTFLGLGTSCVPNPCPQPTGACCAGDGACSIATSDDCSAASGSYLGDAIACSATACRELSGACCLPGVVASDPGRCQPKNPIQCAKKDGRFLGDGTECGIDLCPFVDPLPIPPVATPVEGKPGGAATYSIPVVETTQRLHRDLAGETRLWTYAGIYPGPTIEATAGQPIELAWGNDLRDASNQLRTEHLLPVDSCLHGAEANAPRVVTHLHGGHVAAEFDGHPEATLLPGESSLYLYPNDQLPATLWYHDHALGITRLNVYLGLAGVYLVRDEVEAALDLPAGEFELPLVVQDRAFLADGELDYPAMWDEHFFGDTIVVNGMVWPYLDVKRGKYRFRVVNGANGRTFRLSLSNGAPFHQIGTDGGLLAAPVELTELTLTPGERADLVFDFASYAAGTVLRLINDAPAPFPGSPGVGVVPDVLELRVGSETGHTAPLPAELRPIEPLLADETTVYRHFQLQKVPDACTGSMWTIDGLGFDDITEFPTLGETEIWSFQNNSNTTHPMHLHLNMFQVFSKTLKVIDEEQGIIYISPLEVPANERGWKDTVAVHPNESVAVIVKFTDYAGRFPYHCHILEHEDHQMMRQFETRTPEIFADGFESGAPCEWTQAVGGPGCAPAVVTSTAASFSSRSEENP